VSRKTGTIVPTMGTFVHQRLEHRAESASYAATVCAALRRDLGKTHSAAKTIMRWTGASERTVKHWLAGTRGPSGEHLIMLIRQSDSLLAGFLGLCGRQRGLDERNLVEVRMKLGEIQRLIGSSVESE
jgi:hypothetical protein